MKTILISIFIFCYSGTAFAEPFDFDILNIPRYELTVGQRTTFGLVAAKNPEAARIALLVAEKAVDEKNLSIKRLCILYIKILNLVLAEKHIHNKALLLAEASALEMSSNRTSTTFLDLATRMNKKNVDEIDRMLIISKSHLTSYLEAYHGSINLF